MVKMEELGDRLYDWKEVFDDIVSKFEQKGKSILGRNKRVESGSASSANFRPVRFNESYEAIDLEAFGENSEVDIILIKDLRAVNKIFGRAERIVGLSEEVVRAESSLAVRAAWYLDKSRKDFRYKPKPQLYLLNCRADEMQVGDYWKDMAECDAEGKIPVKKGFSIERKILAPLESALPSPKRNGFAGTGEIKFFRNYEDEVDRIATIRSFYHYMDSLGFKDKERVLKIDFVEHGLGEMLERFYNNDPAEALLAWKKILPSGNYKSKKRDAERDEKYKLAFQERNGKRIAHERKKDFRVPREVPVKPDYTEPRARLIL